MTGLQLVAAIVNSVAWPAAVVVAVVLLRRELVSVFQRVQSLEFPGGKATFANLADFEKVAAVAGKNAGAPADAEAASRYAATEFSAVEALASQAPRQAVIDAWGLLEYHLNVASDQITPDRPHGWPQVAHNLEAWDKWPIVYPAILELRRLRDHTVRSSRPPSSADAARYVSLAQELATTLRTSFASPPIEKPGGGS
ncbi:MAG: hypothetical protein HOV87_07515 [Catenulispora sp.]|nr:hypothetical protein [Catenulispora sp.]